MVKRAVRLGAVFDQPQAVAAAKIGDWREVGGLTVEMHRHDGAGVGGAGGFQSRRVEIEASRVNVHQYGARAAQVDGADRGHGGVAHGNHLVARPHAARAQGEVQRFRAARRADALAGSCPGGELRLERLGFRSQQIASAGQHARDGRVDVGSVFLVGRQRLGLWDGRGHASGGVQ